MVSDISDKNETLHPSFMLVFESTEVNKLTIKYDDSFTTLLRSNAMLRYFVIWSRVWFHGILAAFTKA
jgi:hypothetical protein